MIANSPFSSQHFPVYVNIKDMAGFFSAFSPKPVISFQIELLWLAVQPLSAI